MQCWTLELHLKEKMAQNWSKLHQQRREKRNWKSCHSEPFGLNREFMEGKKTAVQLHRNYNPPDWRPSVIPNPCYLQQVERPSCLSTFRLELYFRNLSPSALLRSVKGTKKIQTAPVLFGNWTVGLYATGGLDRLGIADWSILCQWKPVKHGWM